MAEDGAHQLYIPDGDGIEDIQQKEKSNVEDEVTIQEATGGCTVNTLNNEENISNDQCTPPPHSNSTLSPKRTIGPTTQEVQASPSALNKRNRSAPTWLREYESGEGLSEGEAEFVMFSMTDDPTSFEEAATNEKWVRAMEAEMNSIKKNNTWELVSCPNGALRGVDSRISSRYAEHLFEPSPRRKPNTHLRAWRPPPRTCGYTFLSTRSLRGRTFSITENFEAFEVTNGPWISGMHILRDEH
ncbi:hypothetical protein E3N88_18245 [Mikania micrantha]|uniref:Reverse transcriptase Ty1/copia-type domain-containing protein n=1 Tax=Mikania micrantha TaxID=192012 RepID=A0A5N6NVJ0_9ASTR|nr:hypothetical protein E3N88_18245 [Mikania micrantha]